MTKTAVNPLIYSDLHFYFGKIFLRLEDIFDQIGSIFDQIGDIFDQIGDIFDQIGSIFDQIGDILVSSGTGFGAIFWNPAPILKHPPRPN